MDYDGSGTLYVGGCVVLEVIKQYAVEFPVGSKVYRKDKAKKGILEAIVIKKINRVIVHGYFYVINYVDTFNGVWIEGELVSHEEAKTLAIAYWESVIQQAEADLLAYCNIVV